MPNSPSGESKFSWIEEEWARWFRENSTKVEIVGSGMQALRTGLQKLGLTVGDALIQFRAAFEERMKLYPKLHAQAVPLAQRGWFLSGALGISDLLALAEVCETATE